MDAKEVEEVLEKILAWILMVFCVCFAFQCYFFSFMRAFAGFDSVSAFLDEHEYCAQTGAFSVVFVYVLVNSVLATFSLVRQIIVYYKEKQAP